ncbi:MAG: DUF1850 domain-containing protein [Phascolarctobacterium sp.]|nr:DUF1850 domain-containing protein [Phascolarctobacterium sp.]
MTGSRPFFSNTILIALACVLVFLVWYGTRLLLVLEPEGNAKPIVLNTEAGDTYRLSFTHSVELTIWDEFFQVNGAHDMTMTHTEFSSFGWGFPYLSTDGKFSITKEGRFRLDMNRPYSKVPLRISEQAMQKIIHKDASYDLIALYGQGSAVTIHALRRYEYWFQQF